MKQFLLVAMMAISASVYATSDPVSANDPLEITFIKNPEVRWNHHYQQSLMEQPAWQAFKAEHDKWFVYFNESNHKPHRAYGRAIPTEGGDAESRALWFIENELSGFNIPVGELFLKNTPDARDITFVNFGQEYQGVEVMFGRMTVKLWNDQVVMWGADVYDDIEISVEPSLNATSVVQIAEADMVNTIIGTSVTPELKVLPLPTDFDAEYRLVYEATVYTENENGVPSNYYTLIDANSGDILYRQNMVQHYSSCPSCVKPEHEPSKPEVRTMGMMTVSGTVKGDVKLNSPFDEDTNEALPFLEMNIGSTTVVSDMDGNFTSTASGPTSMSADLSGPWCEIRTNDVVPQMAATLNEGSNDVQWTDAQATIRERSAFRSVAIVHEHVNDLWPDFTGMDVSLTTNIDVSGECNAFYDGASINFFNIGGGCNPTSLISDVVYHEYGHGLNSTYYQSEGEFFQNGAMGEGYADYLGISITNNPNLGSGFYTDTTDGIRQYDTDPKVYPQDLVGEVHGDGEIIMGCWWDTHLLMGADWDMTNDLFVATFDGFQATTPNGGEGAAFTDVLLDALQADDDDGDISNGTPNGFAIVEGFALHGITLLANATFTHNDILASASDEIIEINAVIDIEFPFSEYLEDGKVFYDVNDSGSWAEAELVNTAGNSYTAEIPAQAEGSLVSYYLGLYDTYGNLTNVQPIGAALNDPNLPYYVIVGMTLIDIHDNDTQDAWGLWQTGVPGDNATTGIWEVNLPIGSFSTPGDFSTVVAPYYEHTGGLYGELCFLTGQSSSPDGGVGENDVDGGKTTLRSPVIDLSENVSPIFSYWRWYSNASATSANPGNDMWIVQVSDDAGDSWVDLETTRTQDISWRRKAFRVSDYIDVTPEFRIQMIASDSTILGENLDGGSLVEAAMDDFFLWDEETVGIDETTVDQRLWNVFPNPADDQVIIEFDFNAGDQAQVDVINMLGQVVLTEQLSVTGTGRLELPVGALDAGSYQVRMTREERVTVKKLSVIHR